MFAINREKYPKQNQIKVASCVLVVLKFNVLMLLIFSFATSSEFIVLLLFHNLYCRRNMNLHPKYELTSEIRLYLFELHGIGDREQ